MEEYLVYLKTEDTSTKHFHGELTRLRSLLEAVGKICGFPQLENLILTRDIPPTPKAEFKSYSDAELKRLNAFLVKMDEQTARLMIIHQMLGTRISDTLTLKMDCLREVDGSTVIWIRQMKTHPYEKEISGELAELIRKAMDYTKERFGETEYIFVNEKEPTRPLQYNTVQYRVLHMIHKEDIRDDEGNLFGFGTHMYRHYYGVKLTEMHLDDWTIAKLLGHSSIKNVKYYRKMSNQLLADETRRARHKLSELILANLDGWDEEYEQIRYDDSLE
jgi:integrase